MSADDDGRAFRIRRERSRISHCRHVQLDAGVHYHKDFRHDEGFMGNW